MSIIIIIIIIINIFVILIKADKQLSNNRANSKLSNTTQQETQQSRIEQPTNERKTFQNPRPGLSRIQFKSKKQQLEEEAKRNILKAKIKCNYKNNGCIFSFCFVF